MPYPPTYSRSYDFTAFQTGSPTQPLPADRVENEFDTLAAAYNTLRELFMGAITEDGRPAGAAPPGGYGASAFAASLLVLNSDTLWLNTLGFSAAAQSVRGAASVRALRELVGVWYGTAAGTANVITVTTAAPTASIQVGNSVEFVSIGANTGPVTVNVDGRGAQAVVRADGGAMTGGEIPNASLIRLVWNGTNWRLYAPAILVPPGTPPADTSPVSRAYLETVVGDNPGFRNAVINGDFSVNQRLVLPVSAGGAVYVQDRWVYVSVGGSRTVSAYTATNTDRLNAGEENFTRGLQIAFAGGAAAGELELLSTRLENVRRFAGKTVTVSFYARATAGAPAISIELAQSMGTGGSPSPDVTGIGGSNRVTLSASLARYTATIAVPALTGVTLGTNGNDSMNLNLWLSGNTASHAARVPGIVPQSATVQILGVQVEEGARPTPFEFRPRGVEFALCQRYLQRHNVRGIYINGSGYIGQVVPAPVAMRTQAPAITYTDTLNAPDRVTVSGTAGFSVSSGGAILLASPGGHLSFGMDANLTSPPAVNSWWAAAITLDGEL